MAFPTGSVAVITGAAPGIVRALASRMAREGVALALSDVNAEGLAETAQQAAQHGVKVSVHNVNVADLSQMENFVAEVLAQHGRATHIINNAGVGMLGTVEQMSLDDIEWLMGINFWGVVYGTKLFLPVLRQQAHGHIVNISSVFGFFAPVGQAAYCASKFAVRGFTEALRHELEDTHIKVSTVHPGGISTNIARASRVSAGADPSEKDRAAAFFDKVARTTPDKAADVIVRGMMQGKPRILIGADAWALDKLIRTLPLTHWKLVRSQMEWSKLKK